MKKLITAGLLSVAVLTLTSAPADAGLLFNRCGRHCSKYSTYICVRPYNAFSPVCFGSVTGVGCIPFGGPQMAAPFMPSVFAQGPVCCENGFHGGHGPIYLNGDHGDHGPANGGDGKQMPPAGKGFTPPNPTPVPGNTLHPSQMSYYYSPVHQAAYQPTYPMGYPGGPQQGYYPGYNAGYYYPGYYYPQQGFAVPSYWYGSQQ